MPNRRDVLTQLACAATSCGLARASTRMPRIGWLTAQQPGSLTPYLSALRHGLAEQRLPEGHALEILYRYGNDDLRLVPELARDLVRSGIELLIVQGAAVPQALKLDLRIPIIFVTSADPVSAGYAKSLTEPIGNWTGVTFMGFEFLGKRLEFLKDTLPAASYVTVVGNPLHPGSEIELSSSEAAGRRLGIAVDFIATPNRPSLDEARATLIRSRPHAISLLPDGFAVVHHKAIMDMAAELRIPVISGWPMFAQAGALCTYGPQLPQIYRRVAHYVGRILGGTRPVDLPIERPSQFELILNQMTARTFGLTFPRALIARADEVIE